MRRKERATSDMRTEYHLDYSTAVRGKYFFHLLKEGANVAVLDPDVAKEFPTSAAVNEALRALLKVVESTRRLSRDARRRTPAAPQPQR